ncbi:MAG: alpha/beta fold hydrolase [Gammaproteobacteria bacterium]
MAQPMSVRDFVRQAEFQQVQISPTGKYLAIVSSLPKNPHEYVLATFKTQSLVKQQSKPLNFFKLGNHKMFGPVFWVSDKRIAVETVTHVGGFNQPYLTGALYAMNADGGSTTQLMPLNNRSVFAGLLSMLPDRDNYILVEAYTLGHPTAYLLDTRGGNGLIRGGNKYYFKRAVNPSNGDLATDHNGDVRLGFGFNTLSGTPEIFYRAAGAENWQNFSKAIPIYVDTHGLSTPNFVTFTPDNKKIYLTQYTDNKNQTRALYLANPDTKTEKLIYANKTVDVGGSDFAGYGPLIYSYNDKNLVGLRIMPGKVETLALDSKSPKMRDLAALAQTFPKQQVEITSATRDGSESVVKVWSDTNPGTYYLFSHKPKLSLTQLFKEEPWVNPATMSPMRPITFKARDGVTLHGYLTVPKNSNGKDLPMLVVVHGGPYGIRDHWGYDPEVQLFASRGYAVLQVNYRGSGGYGNKLVVLGIQHWGDTMQDDVTDGVNWAIKQGVADPKRICIYGISYGGYSALMSAERFPDLYQCTIGYSGVYDLFVLKTRKGDIDRNASGRLYLHEILGSSDAKLKKFSPVYQVGSLKVPVLLMHGGQDVRAPVKGYDEMVAAIKKHGTPLETLYFPQEGHGFYKVGHRVQAYTKMLAFLNKYIGPGANAVASTKH